MAKIMIVDNVAFATLGILSTFLNSALTIIVFTFVGDAAVNVVPSRFAIVGLTENPM